jgi:2-iminobutanoate/2-iminopropanoate deaminase
MSKVTSVHTDNAPKAVGPYSQAAIAGELIFCSGQIGIDPQSGEVVVGIENQTHQVMKNISAVLAAASSDMEHILKTTIYLSDMNNYGKVNELYGSYFTVHKPARATVEVARLPKDVLIEIDAIATKK